MKKTGTYCSLLAVALLYGTAAQGQQNFYTMAKDTASQLVSGAWTSLGQDCHNTDTLVQIIGDGVDRVVRDLKSGTFKGRAASSFGNGYINGLTSALGKIVNQCTDECGMIGKASGEWSAGIYCSVSEVIGHSATFAGLDDRPNIVCGSSYRTRCEASFIGTAKKSCQQYAKGNSFYTYYSANRGGCCSYTHKD
jgi:hypothetical protein